MGFRIEFKKEENLKKILFLFNDNQKMAFLEIYELPVEIPRLFWYFISEHFSLQANNLL